jgi:hypothetical protein
MNRDFRRSLGLELAGGKSARSAVAVLDHFPKSQRLILSELVTTKLVPQGDASSDDKLLESLSSLAAAGKSFQGLAVHGPLTLPPSLRPGNRDADLRWMTRLWESLDPRPRPFASYLQRPVEVWLRHKTPEGFPISDALGSNAAPLAARLQFLSRKLPKPLFEVFPRASVVRLVKSLGLPKTLAARHADLEKGVAAREEIFSQLLKKLPQVFIYDGDLESMILHIHHFHAFVSAVTGHMAAAGMTETPPRGFPKGAGWIELPRSDIDWGKVL